MYAQQQTNGKKPLINPESSKVFNLDLNVIVFCFLNGHQSINKLLPNPYFYHDHHCEFHHVLISLTS
ncbi:hypothetical protein DERF_011540 [Dermatophagoides farinae]|uniref:Uncharacterized protein n=1 Tax=Dermatophagoides farinae TaxID=6954 RepID=A0A922L1R0_DERFA|nr:hypothetical protein DERF_011540 [Dermatophagoides farinae]